ncbi:GTP cyclohydrolase II [Franzmannia pantelleriensis]|uniref:GTP cyclohydrolase-2 n=1 Tax=Franzmannia pantelleriensis TaxID=48727 RepID=A0A1G9G866_9GAMM|nr:GTP cyclohydrolase II [Halomonas pantelleriensis]SDK96836.1 GTP cyclohydrolase II [Halomonas pantelleriensis]
MPRTGHHVERAIFDLRRGVPVVLQDADTAILIQPLEGLQASRLGELQADASLVVSRHRLAVLGGDPERGRAAPGVEAMRLPLGSCGPLDLARLERLAFGAQPEPRAAALAQPASVGECGALALMRRALLIPAALTVTLTGEARELAQARIAAGEWLSVDAEAAIGCFDSAAGMLTRVSDARIPLADAPESRFILFREPDGLREHVAVVIGEQHDWQPAVPLRLHSACLTGDLFGSLRCDCGEQLRNAVSDIESMGGGVLLYLAQEGRGIGLANKLRAYTLQDGGLDTVDADQVLGFGDDERHYRAAVDMLGALQIQRVQLLTNNPQKIASLEAGGIEVVERQALYGRLNDHNRRYLSAKAERAGHLLDDVLHADSSRSSACK